MAFSIAFKSFYQNWKSLFSSLPVNYFTRWPTSWGRGILRSLTTCELCTAGWIYISCTCIREGVKKSGYFTFLFYFLWIFWCIFILDYDSMCSEMDFTPVQLFSSNYKNSQLVLKRDIMEVWDTGADWHILRSCILDKAGATINDGCPSKKSLRHMQRSSQEHALLSVTLHLNNYMWW